MIGRTLAHDRVIGTLGAGGMGEVYRATDLRLGREVAIKTLPEEFARDPHAQSPRTTPLQVILNFTEELKRRVPTAAR